MDYQESNSIYHTVVNLHKMNDEMGILDILDNVDSNVLDFSNIKILHMVYMYIMLKKSLKDCTFVDLINKLKTSNLNSQLVYNIIIKQFVMNIDNKDTLLDNKFSEQMIDDEYFSFIKSKMCIEKFNHSFTFDKYMNEITFLYKKISIITSDTDTDFLQINEMKQSLYHSIIKYFKNKDQYDFVLEPSTINTKMTKINNLLLSHKYNEVNDVITEIKNIYGYSRTKNYCEFIMLKQQFYILPTYENALKYDNIEHELTNIKNEPNVNDFILFDKLQVLSFFCHCMRLKKNYNDYDKLIKIINLKKNNLLITYQKFLEHKLKINSLTYHAHKTQKLNEYFEFLTELIDSKNTQNTISTYADYILIHKKIIQENYKKIIIFFNTYCDYICYNIKKHANDLYIAVIPIIVKSYFNAHLLNSTQCVDNILNSFDLTIDFFKSKPNNTSYCEISAIYEKIIKNSMSVQFIGYKIMDNNEDKSMYQCDSNNYPICLICETQMDCFLTTIIQCSQCEKYIGHLFCFEKYNLFGPRRPCCENY